MCEKCQRITCLLAGSVVQCISNAMNLRYPHMVPNIVCCWFTLTWNDSSSSCTIWEKSITKRCFKNEHCRQKQILAPKSHNWCSNVSTQNWGILLWIPTQCCTCTRPYHRLCGKHWVPDERMTSCPLLAVGKRYPKNWQRSRWYCLCFH